MTVLISNAAPNVPTMADAGYPGFVVIGSCGMLAPANTPRAIIDRLQSAVAKALSDATVRENLAKLGADAVGSTPEEYDRFNRDEIEKWIKLAANVGITPE